MKKFLIACAFMVGFSGVAAASEQGTHVHVAAFFKMPGQESFKWPDEIPGEDIIGSLDGKADFLVLTQTVGIHDGDVLNIQNDVLRSGDGSSGYQDLGIDCQLSVNTSTGPDWTVGGKCDVFLPMLSTDGSKVTGIIMPHPIETEKVWHHVWDDAKTGVAVYFFKETGAVLGR